MERQKDKYVSSLIYGVKKKKNSVFVADLPSGSEASRRWGNTEMLIRMCKDPLS